MAETPAQLRDRLSRAGLRRRDALPDPIAQFRLWYDEAQRAVIDQADAMTLATAADGRPSTRVVLLKELDARGFVFYTNYESRKGEELARNPRASLCFFWKEVMRQVRIDGTVTKVPAAESAAYFRTRPFESRVGAWVSAQSRVLTSRDEMDERFLALKSEYEGRDVPLPPYWGGYVLAPDEIEFWASRPNRLHDRIRYTRTGDAWRIERLAP